MRRLTILAAAAALATCSSAQVDATWSNPTGGNWTTATNWAGGIVPNATNAIANLTLPGTYTVTSAATVNLATLNLNAPGTTLLISSGSFTVPAVNLTQGTLSLGSAATSGNGGTWSVDPAARLLLSSTSGQVISSLDNVRINGAAEIAGSFFQFGDNVSIGSIRPKTGNSWIASSRFDSTVDLDESYSQRFTLCPPMSSPMEIVPTSVLRVSSPIYSKYLIIDNNPYVFSSNQVVTNRGLIELTGDNAAAYVLVRSDGFNNQGTIRIDSGTFLVAAPVELTDLGLVELSGTGNLNVDGSTTLAALSNVQQTGGTFKLSADVDFLGAARTGTLFNSSPVFDNAVFLNGSWDPGAGYALTSHLAIKNFTIGADLVLQSGGEFSVRDANSVHGDIYLRAPGTSFGVDGSNGYALSRTLVVDGSGGTRSITGILTVAPQGTVRLAADLAPGSALTMSTLRNAGLVESIADNATLSFFLESNTGVIRMTSGKMIVRLPTAATNLGTIDLSPGVELSLTSGSLLNPFSTPARVTVAGATIGADLTSDDRIDITLGGVANAITLAAPTIAIPGTVTGSATSLRLVANALSVTGISIPGQLRLSSPVPYDVATTGSIIVGGLTVDTANNTFTNAGRLEINAGRLTLPANATQILNTGTLIAGGGLNTYSLPINNLGVVRFSGGTNTWVGTANGRIELTGSGATLNLGAVQPATTIAVSAGTLQLTGTRELVDRNFELSGGLIRLQGLVNLGAGKGNWTRTGGTVELQGIADLQGSTLALSSADAWRMVGGTIRNGRITTASNTSLVPTGTTSTLWDVIVTGPVVLSNGTRLTLGGTLDMDSMQITGGTLAFTDNTTFSGLMLVQGPPTSIQGPPSGTLRLTAAATLRGAASNAVLGSGQSFLIRNEGTITTTFGSMQIAAAVVNSNSVFAGPGSVLSLRNLRPGTGTIAAAAAVAGPTPLPGGTIDLYGTLTDTLLVPTGAVAKFGGTFDTSPVIAGELQFVSNTIVAAGRTISGSGTVRLVAPSLTLRTGSQIAIPVEVGSGAPNASVVVSGSGVVTGPLTAGPGGGRISLSNAASLTATRIRSLRVTLNNASSLTLADSTPGPAGDPAYTSILISLAMANGPTFTDVLVDVRNNDLILRAGLTGLDDLRLLASRFVDTGGIAGIGSTRQDGMSLSFGLASQAGIASFNAIPVSPSDVVIKYTFAGDANLDGLVDAIDLSIWQTNLGLSGPLASPVLGDFDFSGTIDLADRAVWQANEGNGATGQAVVPEPTTLGLGMTAALGLLARRRSRERSR